MGNDFLDKDGNPGIIWWVIVILIVTMIIIAKATGNMPDDP